MVQLDMFNQPLIVARQNRGPADLFPKGFSLPFEIRFPTIDGFMRAARGGSEESRNGFNADTWAIEDRSVKHRIRRKSRAEFGSAIFSDNCHPVVSWCRLIHNEISFE